ncbi:MAG: S41 family peptidase [Flavobacteriales bacterium]|jgi:carboxyl-terminal processing protease|nr:S41 family peptidase [Flavobacteriales bacterium]
MKLKHLLILLTVGIVLSSGTTYTLSYYFDDKDDDNYFEITKNLRTMSAVYNVINTYYVDEPQPGKMMKTGIDAMLKSLDPYTVYIPESQIEDYRYMTTGQYGGIGSLIQKQGDHIVISEPYEGFPAQKGGLKAGDILIEVDGVSVEGKETSDMSKILKGGAGTALTIKFKRGEETKEITLKREEVKIAEVPYFGMIDDEVGYVKLTSFTNTASKNIGKALRTLKDSLGMKKVILDLRGNGGGLLHEAVNIVNFWVPKGQLVVETKGRLETMNRSYKTQNNAFDENMPIAVLINDRSASASEIVSGSIQDLDRGIVIGERSYGKGLVQQTKDINFGSKVKVTIAKYYTPSGRCIQKLDYSHRDGKGKVHEVSDSLIHSFKTKNGRTVKDGRGIDPDVVIEEEIYNKLTAVLVTKNMLFEYATQYERAHPSIASSKKFELTADEYQDFIAFIKNQEDISYTTDSQELLEQLKEVAKDEKYFNESESEFKLLLEKLTPNLENDLIRYQEEIKELLENEIVSRYYFQKGRVEASLKHDTYIDKALDILNNNERYEQILTVQ